jgi:tetratricopeptide (TPR) repeat protein
MATQGQSLSLDQAIQQASKLNQAGRLQEAHSLLSQVLKKAPKNAVALQQMAIALHKAGKTADAITHIEKAIKIRKHEAAFLSMAGEMHRANGNLDKAIEYGKKAVALKPNVPAFLSNLGVAYFDNGDLELAENFHVKALATDPHYIPSLNNLGGIAQARHQLAKAKGFYDKALALNPNHFDTLNNLGALLTEQRQPEAAIDVLVKAINLNPRRAIAHCNIGFALFAMEQFEKAKMGFDEALKLDHNSSKAAQGLANYYSEKKQYNNAFEIINGALKSDQDNAELHCVLGNIYRAAEDTANALLSYNRSIELSSTLVTAFVAKGELLTELGELDEADALIKHALILDENNTAARLALLNLKKVSATDPNLQWLINESRLLPEQSPTKALPIHFTLGKCYDDIKQYDDAFKHYQAGCAIKRSRIHYDAAAHTQNTRDIHELFSKDYIDKMRGCGIDSNLPIFILGMPRSGTSLTEQIIASHPLVHGAGELPDLAILAKGGDTQYPASLEGFTASDYLALGKEYIAGLHRRAPKAAHITDKMPANFRYIGLIHLALPSAKIVHINRNPVDTCLSGFSKQFKRGQHHSYDLTELGQYYHDYHELMAHWRAVLPDGSFYDIQYEDIVADTENQARKLIEYCGLPWDDACLDFHKLERSVKTASVTQVRKPIYNSSVERWRAYEQHLGPLFEGLGDLAPK